MEPTSLKAVLVGCGSICRSWLDHATTRSDLEIVGLVDLVPTQAEAIRESYELDRVVIADDLDRALHTLKPDIVFDCTIPEAHTGVTLTALAHGCHVLGEKPMASSMADAQAYGRRRQPTPARPTP